VQNCEIYLDLSSIGIMGEAQAQHYEQQIELQDWSWGLGLKDVNNANPPHGAGKNIKLNKRVDRSTTALLKHLEQAIVIPKGVMVVVGRGEKNLMVRFELEDILFTNYTLAVKSDDKLVDLSETWELDYKKIKIQYVSRSDSSNDVRGKVGGLGVASFTLTVPPNATLAPSEALQGEEPGVETKQELGKVRQEVMRLEALISQQKLKNK
jgi:type VI protein secretion system component Hcp